MTQTDHCDVHTDLCRRGFFTVASGLGMLTAMGCRPQGSHQGKVDLVWGRRGMSDGRLLKPRAITIDSSDRLFIADMTGRIQVFDPNGEFVRSFRTPAAVQGKPCGLGIGQDGNLLVADTHYYRMLVYRPDGTPIDARTIGGKNGTGPGEFGFVTDAVQDKDGCYYISEYGELDRIQKFSPTGEFLMQWGEHGGKPGQFRRPQCMAFDHKGQLWVTDACNHRLQVFSIDGERADVVQVIGRVGRKPGEFRFPYGLVLDRDRMVYVCEFGNHRIQKLDLKGEPIKQFGAAGRQSGEFHQPWALAQDSKQRLHVLDSYNHRVQRVVM